MSSIIRNFADWQRLYEDTSAAPASQPAATAGQMDSEREKQLQLVGQSIMRRLCIYLLAKSEAITRYFPPAKDQTGTKDIGTGTFKYVTTAPFIKTDIFEPLAANIPAPKVDPATFGMAADPVLDTAKNAAAAISKRGVQTLPLDKVDLSDAKTMMDKLIASSGKRIKQTDYGDPALQHPMFPETEYNEIRLKSPAFNGGTVKKTANDTGEAGQLGSTMVSLSKNAANDLIKIQTAIVNAIIPADQQAVKDIIIRSGSPAGAFGYVQKPGINRATLTNQNDRTFFPPNNPDYTVKSGMDEQPITAPSSGETAQPAPSSAQTAQPSPSQVATK